LGDVGKRDKFRPYWDSNAKLHSVASRYTDGAIPVPYPWIKLKENCPDSRCQYSQLKRSKEQDSKDSHAVFILFFPHEMKFKRW
jgi:hypothetical protein